MEDGYQIECAGFHFFTNFDSANLARVELVEKKPIKPVTPQKASKTSLNRPGGSNSSNGAKRQKTAAVELPDFEFNLWTNPDCFGTEFENSNRTWFHFGMRGGTAFGLIKLNVVDLNKQSKMYSQGMAPVWRTEGRGQWERVREKPVYTVENNVFTLSFKFRMGDNAGLTNYFAFTYPFSYIDLCSYLSAIDSKMSKPDAHLPKTEIRFNKGLKIVNDVNDAIYYHRECLCYTLERRRIDLITISSHHNITAEREPRLKKLFPDDDVPRCFRFQEKKVVFISARVHPGETPSTFVFNGLLNLLVQKDDPVALLLRRQFVFKLIPMLNPDGVARGHYRTDTRGVNLNRFYLNPSFLLHPSIYAARALIRYYHLGDEVDEASKPEVYDTTVQADPNEFSSESSSELESPDQPSYNCQMHNVQNQINGLNLTESHSGATEMDTESSGVGASKGSGEDLNKTSAETTEKDSGMSGSEEEEDEDPPKAKEPAKEARRPPAARPKASPPLWSRPSAKKPAEPESGLFLYIDMHGHASKKGIFMYGNHFDRVEDSVECMLLPKIMSINSQNFHFPSCNFTEKNMFVRDKRDGTSREGSGRVAVLRATGLVRSYTLECNYNTGRSVNMLPQCSRELPGRINYSLVSPPKYSPLVYEECGRSLAVSILDLTNSNPWSRIPNSEHHTLVGLREWLRVKSVSEGFICHRLPKVAQRQRPSRSSQTQVLRQRASAKLLPAVPPGPEDSERKENIRGVSASAAAEPGQSKRGVAGLPGVVGVVSVVRAHRTHRALSATTRVAKFKQFTQDSLSEAEKRVTLSTVSLGLNCEDRSRAKIPPLDPCMLKQGPKRLKMSKLDPQLKLSDPPPGPSSADLVVYSRLAPLEGHALAKKRPIKSRTQLSPLKYKKSLEKRRGSDSSRKKSKTLFKKAGKIVLTTSDLNKGLVERKRRKN